MWNQREPDVLALNIACLENGLVIIKAGVKQF